MESHYYAEYEKLRGEPAGGLIGSAEWNDIFVQAGYYVFGWEDVASAFSRWVNDADPSGLVGLYPPPGDDNGYAIYLAVQCTDAKWPTSYAKFKRDNERVDRKAPFLTWGNAWFNAPCLYWPEPPSNTVRVEGRDAPPILLISETLDAATPYSGSLRLRREFPKSVLVEGVGGTTHSASLSGLSCVDDTIAAYLATGALPPRVSGDRSDKQCDPLPQPVPTEVIGGAAAAARSAASADVSSRSALTVHAPQRSVVLR